MLEYTPYSPWKARHILAGNSLRRPHQSVMEKLYGLDGHTYPSWKELEGAVAVIVLESSAVSDWTMPELISLMTDRGWVSATFPLEIHVPTILKAR